MDDEEFKSENEEPEEEHPTDELTYQNDVEQMSKDNPKSYNFYSRLVGRQTLLYSSNAHDARICHNLQTNYFSPSIDGFNVGQSFESFPFESSLPIPINTVKGSCTDSALRSQLEKMHWKESVQNRVKLINGTDKHLENVVKRSKNIYSMPKYLMEFVQLVDADPDPYQDSKFNWYFSGKGNLHHFVINNTCYLLQGIDNKICITPFVWQGNSIHLEQSKLLQFECNEKLYIKEVSIYSASTTEVYIAVRTRCIIHMVKVGVSEKTGKLIVHPLRVLKSEVPATSVAYLDKITALCTYVDNTIHLKDTVYGKDTIIKLPNKLQSSKNNWLSVSILDENNFVVANRKHIFVLDKRTGGQHGNILINDVTDLCEDITLLHKSTNKESCFYVGSYHRLFMTDIRFWDLRPNMMLQRWTHGMQTAPLYACSAPFEGYKEIICLANQVHSDVRLVEDTYTKLHLDTNILPSSSIMPWSPKCLRDSLRYAQMRGFCIDPRLRLKERLSMSITGISLIDNSNGNPILLLNNSCGDIFQNQLMPKGYPVHENVPEILESWAERLLQSRPMKRIAVSSRDAIGPFMRDQLRLYLYKSEPPLEELNESKKTNLLGEINVERSLELELLSAWNVEPDFLPWTVS